MISLHAGAPRIAVLVGDDRHRFVARDGMRLQVKGNSDMAGLAAETGLPVAALQVGPGYFEQAYRHDLSAFGAVLNIVSDPDQNPLTLRVVADLEAAAGPSVVNSGRATLRATRDRVAAVAAAIPGFLVPATAAIARRDAGHALPPGFRFPAILRERGSHGGRGLVLVRDVEEARRRMRPGIGYYISEFVDYRSPDGLYRKWRFFVVGERVIAQSLVASRDVVVHAGSRGGSDVEREMREELDFFHAFDSGAFPALAPAMRDLARALGLEILGLDVCLAGPDRMILFEANATMNFGGRKVDAHRPLKQLRRHMAVQALRALLEERAAGFARET